MLRRQGDVLIENATEVPEGVHRRKDQVLYHGEATGHRHRIAEGPEIELYELGATLYLKVLAPEATVVHDEHGPITLPTGIYRIWQQREYRPEGIFPVGD